MYSFSEEGELLEDLSADPIIPGVMGQGSLVVREGKIYAVGWRKFNNTCAIRSTNQNTCQVNVLLKVSHLFLKVVRVTDGVMVTFRFPLPFLWGKVLIKASFLIYI